MNKIPFFILLIICGMSCKEQPKGHQKGGEARIVLERKEALRIAEEIALKEYGEVIYKQLPLHGELIGDSVWRIEGTLASGADGGTVYMELRRHDLKLLKITHYK